MEAHFVRLAVPAGVGVMVILSAAMSQSSVPASAPARPKGGARVTLTAGQRAAADLAVVEAARVTMPEVVHTTGTVEINQDRVAHLGARLPGFALEVFEKGNLGQHVAEGDPLVLVHSLEYGKAQVEYRKALQVLALRQKTFDREKDLYERKISSGREFVEAGSELEQARIDVEARTNELEIAGVGKEELAECAAGRSRLGCITVRAPVAGTIIDKHVVRGEHVETETTLFTIADLENFWLFADVYEHDLARIRTDQAAEVRVAAWPGELFTGRITCVADVMDVQTRTLKVRIGLANRDRKLKAGMFATAFIAVGRRDDVLAVPAAALQAQRQQSIVFVEVAPDVFERRLVRTGVGFADRVELIDGVEPGEKVVTSGSFLLKSELEKASFESD